MRRPWPARSERTLDAQRLAVCFTVLGGRVSSIDPCPKAGRVSSILQIRI